MGKERTVAAIEIDSERSDREMLVFYPKLVETMRQHICAVLDESLAGIRVADAVAENMAVAAARVAVEVCPYCWERERGCKCWDDS